MGDIVELPARPVLSALCCVAAVVAGCSGDSRQSDVGDARRIVFGRSIGGVHLGMPRSRVVHRYGRPATNVRLQYFPVGTRYEGKTLVRATYRVHGGTLVVGYVNDRVRVVTTTSTFYRTATGVGVGTDLPRDRCFRRDEIGHIGPRGCKQRWRGFLFDGECVNAWLADEGRITTALHMGFSRRIRAIEIGESDVTLYCF